jgi:hypothetical protein
MSDPVSTEEWRKILNGEIPGVRMFQNLWKKIPSEPRSSFATRRSASPETS